jgi:hypothetical protein
VIKSYDIVPHFTKILRASFYSHTSLSRKELTKGRLCAFYPAREYRLTMDKRPNQQVRIGQPAAFTSKSPQEIIGI